MNLILSILMLAGLAMTVGAALLARRNGVTKQAALMAVAALVMFANVAILVWPV
jgi:hypothetical protein